MKYVMTGRIYPERIKLTISEPIALKIEHNGNIYSLRIRIESAQVIAQVDSENSTLSELDTLKNVVSHVVSSLIDTYSYLEGRWQQVEMTTVVNCENSEERVFGIEIPILAESKEERPLKDFGKLMNLSIQNMNLRRALASIRTAMASPDDSGFFCYHAVEAISNHFKIDNTKDSQSSWKSMRTALNIDKDYIVKGIKPFADPVRHGGVSEINDAERAELFIKVWKIFDRMFVLLDLGTDKLDESKFPMLKV